MTALVPHQPGNLLSGCRYPASQTSQLGPTGKRNRPGNGSEPAHSWTISRQPSFQKFIGEEQWIGLVMYAIRQAGSDLAGSFRYRVSTGLPGEGYLPVRSVFP